MNRVLMIGPDRSVHGGISGVVNMFFDAGIDKEIELKYIGTMKEGSKLYKLLVAFGAYLRFLWVLKKYDIVHVNVASDSSFIRKIPFIKTAYRKQKKIIIHQHGGNFESWYGDLSDGLKWRVKAVCDMADVMLVLAPGFKDFFGTITDKDKIQVFPNAIPVPDNCVDKDYSNHNMLFLGRICKTKGMTELFECVPALIKKYPDMKLYLGGIWEDSDYEKKAAKYPDNVEYIGWISGKEKEEYLKKCSVFVLPTYFEGLPVSVLEAMAAGCIVVTTRVGGIPLIIDSDKEGILIEPQNVKALEQALLSVLGDENTKMSIGQVAHEKIKKDYDIEAAKERLVSIYSSL